MDVALPEQYRPLRRVEYDQLVALGVFQDERIELLDGVLVPMSPIGPRHSSAIDQLTLLLVRALGDRARIRVQNPFIASEISEPQPDLLVAPLRSYTEDHPDEAYLVIEVAESSLRIDRGRKLRIYAERGVPEYWIVDVVARRIEVHREPDGSTFRTVRVHEGGGAIEPLRFPGVSIRVSDVFE
ncbi:MAG TPA: Uma2 family endonuclease [Polyangiaceae bacterium]|nr:Uma2 family endonuclease [Polyangiaceae bacterium]